MLPGMGLATGLMAFAGPFSLGAGSGASFPEFPSAARPGLAIGGSRTTLWRSCNNCLLPQHWDATAAMLRIMRLPAPGRP